MTGPNMPWLLVSFAITVIATGCGGGSSDSAAGAQPLVSVGTAQIASGDFTPVLHVIGSVVPRAGHIARLASPVASRITAVAVNRGDRVTSGEVLVKLDLPRFAAEQAGAEAALAAARSEWERATRLEHEGITPKRVVEQRATELAQARSMAVNARRNSALATLRSPLNGTVTVMNAVLGAEVDPSSVLVEVVDPHSLDIALTVTPAQAGSVAPGMSATITGANLTSDSLGTAVVVSVGSEVDTLDGGVTVRVRLAHPRRTLRLGEAVAGSLLLPAITGAILAPTSALVPSGDGTIAFVVDSSGTAHRRDVTIAARSGDTAVVTSGLEVGDRVVTRGAYGMVDGARVASDSSVQR